MSQYNDMYNMCCQYQGKRVRIREKCGKVHVGTITRVDRGMVWLMPDGGMGGGYGFGWGWGWGGGGFGLGIAIGAIAGVALAGAFFW